MGFLPLSLIFLAASLATLFVVTNARPWRAWQRHEPRWLLRGATVSAVAAVTALLFAFGHMVFFGNSDYRRSADAVVVFGARVYRDGRPSLALSDRVRTAAALVREGYAPILIVSGGPGDGDVHEAEAMRALAIAEGVADDRILVDRNGLDTRATVRNTQALLGPGHKRVLAVSHSYHLPRIKLSFQQQGGRAYTVPAHETRTLIRLPWYMARETLAFWAQAFHIA
jgi:uncharacterized SAM-binding protein YcdF (DUF218 family)